MLAGPRGVTVTAALALTVGGCMQARSWDSGAPTSQTARPEASVLRSEDGCRSERPRRRPAGDRPRYRLWVRVGPARTVVTGRLRVRFTPDLPTDRLVFRLWPNGPRPASAGARLSTGTVTAAGRALTSTRPNPTTLVVRPERRVRAGEQVTVAMPWRLRVPRGVADRLSVTGDAVLLGSFFPLLAWEPGRGWATDPPTTGFAEASSSPAADFNVTVSAPRGDRVLASGRSADGAGSALRPGRARSASALRPGRARSAWRARAVRDFALAVGRFETASRTVRFERPIDVVVGVERGLTVSPRPFLDKIEGALRDLSRRYGPYPWGTLSLAVMPALGQAGIEYPTMIFQGSESLDWATVHEVAHSWFYGLVGNNQARHPWLDEGITTWAQARADGMLEWFQSYPVPVAARGRLGKPMSFWDRRSGHYFAGVYVAGVKALAALGRPQLVDCALRSYVAAHAYRIAWPRDVVVALSRVRPRAPEVLVRFGVRVAP
jgi:hypothetical protein